MRRPSRFTSGVRDHEKALGPEHPAVARSLSNLATLYGAQGRYAKAEPLLQQSLAIMKKTLGPEHPAVATTLEDYAELLTQLKRDKEAADLRAQAMAIRAADLPPDSNFRALQGSAYETATPRLTRRNTRTEKVKVKDNLTLAAR